MNSMGVSGRGVKGRVFLGTIVLEVGGGHEGASFPDPLVEHLFHPVDQSRILGGQVGRFPPVLG